MMNIDKNNTSTYYYKSLAPIPIWDTPIFSVGIGPYRSFSVPTPGIILADKPIKERKMQPSKKTVRYLDSTACLRTAVIDIYKPRDTLPEPLYSVRKLCSANDLSIRILNEIAFKRKVLEEAASELPDGTPLSRIITVYNDKILGLINKQQINDEQKEQRMLKRQQEWYNQGKTPDTPLNKLMLELQMPFEIYNFITSIGCVSIEREPENKDKSTFDFIRVYASTKAISLEEKRQILSTHKREILRLILTKIKRSPNFQRYDIPINFLRLTQCTLTRDQQIVFVFELKNIN